MSPSDVDAVHGSPEPSRRERVLVVDDDPDIARFIQVNLMSAGFQEVLTAPDGEDGLVLTLALRPDLISTGVMMPRIDGFEMVRRLREDHGLTQPVIVFVTAKALPTDRERGLQVGADDYFIKPFDPIELFARIDELLRQTEDRRRDLASSRRASGDLAVDAFAELIETGSVVVTERGRSFPYPLRVNIDHIEMGSRVLSEMGDEQDVGKKCRNCMKCHFPSLTDLLRWRLALEPILQGSHMNRTPPEGFQLARGQRREWMVWLGVRYRGAGYELRGRGATQKEALERALHDGPLAGLTEAQRDELARRARNSWRQQRGRR